MTGNIYSLIQSSSHTPKIVALDRWSVGLELIRRSLFRAKIYVCALGGVYKQKQSTENL